MTAPIRLPDELDWRARTAFDVPETVPRAVGWRMLIRIAEPPDKIGNIFIPGAWKDNEKALTMTAQIVQQGADCYSDRQRFPSGEPWCYPGDWVLISKYAGTRFAVRGVEYRVINDDEIQAVFIDGEAAAEVKRA